MTAIASSNPVLSPERVSSKAGTCPRVNTVTPRGGAPARSMAFRTSPTTSPRRLQGLGVMQIAEKRDLFHLNAKFFGEFPACRERGTLHGDFDRRRRTEAHDLADNVTGLERKRHVRQRLLQDPAQVLLQILRHRRS